MEAACLCGHSLAPVGFADRVASSRFASASAGQNRLVKWQNSRKGRNAAEWWDNILQIGYQKRAKSATLAEYKTRDWDYRDIPRIPSHHSPIPELLLTAPDVSKAAGTRVSSLVSERVTERIQEQGGQQEERFIGIDGSQPLHHGLSGVALASEVSDIEEQEIYPREVNDHFDDEPTLWARRMLRKLPFLRHISLKAVHEVAQEMEPRTFAAGDHIKSTDNAGLYLIRRGDVYVMSTEGRSIDAPGPGVALLDRGHFFGHEAGPELTERLWPSADLEMHVAGPRDVHVAGSKGVDCVHIPAATLWTVLGKELWLPTVTSCFGACGSSFPGCGPPEVLQALSLNQFRPVPTPNECLLGRGAFGHVGLVEHSRTGALFALKCVNKEPERDPSLAAEIKSLQLVCENYGHPFVGRFVKHFQWQGSTYILQEALLGGDLHQLVREYEGGVMSHEHVVFYAACMVEAIAYLQSIGVAHRDIKLGNFMLDDTGYLKLVDFGYATKVPRGKVTRGRVGTPSYVAPEIVKNFGHSMSVDVWSLGVSIYRMLAGKHPFDSLNTTKTLARIKDPTPPPLPEDKFTPEARSLILGLLRHEPEDRIGWGSGIEELRNHPFFAAIDWRALRNKEIDAPFVPDLVSPTDTGRFKKTKERCVLDCMILPEEDEVQCDTFVGNNHLVYMAA